MKTTTFMVVIAALALGVATQADAKTRHHVVRHGGESGVTVYDRDSPNPNIGWHTDSNGMRVCSYDCDNPEIPGSGARCHNVNWMGMAARECVTNG